jgi:hypothetical protein
MKGNGNDTLVAISACEFVREQKISLLSFPQMKNYGLSDARKPGYTRTHGFGLRIRTIRIILRPFQRPIINGPMLACLAEHMSGTRRVHDAHFPLG